MVSESPHETGHVAGVACDSHGTLLSQARSYEVGSAADKARARAAFQTETPPLRPRLWTPHYVRPEKRTASACALIVSILKRPKRARSRDDPVGVDRTAAGMDPRRGGLLKPRHLRQPWGGSPGGISHRLIEASGWSGAGRPREAPPLFPRTAKPPAAEKLVGGARRPRHGSGHGSITFDRGQRCELREPDHVDAGQPRRPAGTELGEHRPRLRRPAVQLTLCGQHPQQPANHGSPGAKPAQSLRGRVMVDAEVLRDPTDAGTAGVHRAADGGDDLVDRDHERIGNANVGDKTTEGSESFSPRPPYFLPVTHWSNVVYGRARKRQRRDTKGIRRKLRCVPKRKGTSRLREEPP